MIQTMLDLLTQVHELLWRTTIERFGNVAQLWIADVAEYNYKSIFQFIQKQMHPLHKVLMKTSTILGTNMLAKHSSESYRN